VERSGLGMWVTSWEWADQVVHGEGGRDWREN